MTFTVPEGIRELLTPAGGGIRNCACDVVTDLLCLRGIRIQEVASLAKPEPG